MSQYANPELLKGVNVTESLSNSRRVVSKLAAVANTVVIPMDDFNGAVFAWWGTFTGVGLAFEASYDGAQATWINAAAVSVAGSSAVSSLTGLSTPNAYEIYAPGAKHLRVRCTALTTGPMLVAVTPHVFAADPAPVLGASPVLAAISSSGSVLIGEVSNVPRATSGGLSSVGKLLSYLATTNANSLKASAGRLYKVRGYNAAATVKYLKLYNKASAPIVGTDTPVVTLPLKASDIFDIDLIPIGEYFSTGIAYAITTGAPDADTGALTANDIVGLMFWYA